MVEQKELSETSQAVELETDEPKRVIKLRRPRRIIRKPELELTEEQLREMEEELVLPETTRRGRCGGCDVIMTNEPIIGGFTAKDTK